MSQAGKERMTVFRELLEGVSEPFEHPAFDFEKKVVGISSKVKRLLLSVKIMARDPIDPISGKAKALKHL